ncbi:hypothetical protein BTIS_1068 [Bifidobacterium tissieri]|uniref:Uncharacterized protein n=1 Tax=Bifidobacterium tissieri TaxID=1630162 RepID=A0A261FFB7_9BIFI|nr:hypothetical protein [Bifidobacterium tissieri]OZG57827.1 hypothetical protein BTIS_1068 [Bifidobacterium tissieri]
MAKIQHIEPDDLPENVRKAFDEFIEAFKSDKDQLKRLRRTGVGDDLEFAEDDFHYSIAQLDNIYHAIGETMDDRWDACDYAAVARFANLLRDVVNTAQAFTYDYSNKTSGEPQW